MGRAAGWHDSPRRCQIDTKCRFVAGENRTLSDGWSLGAGGGGSLETRAPRLKGRMRRKDLGSGESGTVIRSATLDTRSATWTGSDVWTRKAYLLSCSGGVDGGGVDEHDGDVVLDGVNPVADGAFEALSVGGREHRLLADGADQYIQEILGNHRCRYCSAADLSVERDGQAPSTDDSLEGVGADRRAIESRFRYHLQLPSSITIQFAEGAARCDVSQGS